MEFCEILSKFARKIRGDFKISFASRLDFHETQNLNAGYSKTATRD